MQKFKNPFQNFLVMRGTKEKLYNFDIEYMTYVYCIDTNELYLAQHTARKKIEKYSDFDQNIIGHTQSIAYFKENLPKECENGQVFNCIDSREIYVGWDKKPVLVLTD